MSKRKARLVQKDSALGAPLPASIGLVGRPARGTTGRQLLLLNRGGADDALKTLKNVSGVSAASLQGGEAADALNELDDSRAVHLPTLNVAVINADPDRIQALYKHIDDDSALRALEPERFVYALWRPSFGMGVASLAAAPDPASAYLRGYRDAVAHLSAALLRQQIAAAMGGAQPFPSGIGAQGEADPFPFGTSAEGSADPFPFDDSGSSASPFPFTDDAVANGGGGPFPFFRRPQGAATGSSDAIYADDNDVTWGLRATLTSRSSLTGKGVKIAILDTGLDFTHPDFAARTPVSQSFIGTQTADDGFGHGTHTAGIAAGSATPSLRPRYGVAPDAELFIGKVLDNLGRGVDGAILAGIDWAVSKKCDIISMSLGSPTAPGESYSPIYEHVAQRALAANCLIVAAAGNESRRDAMPPLINPIGRPANSPSILAVAAIDASLRVASFSNRGLDPRSGQIDLAAPGVHVRSSLPPPKVYGFESGTSMATPFVAGVAALVAQSDPNLRGDKLWVALMCNARRLNASSADVGSGLVQAPSS